MSTLKNICECFQDNKIWVLQITDKPSLYIPPTFSEEPGRKVVFLSADAVDDDLRGPLGTLLPKLRRRRTSELLRRGKTVKFAVTCTEESDDDSIVYVRGVSSATAAGLSTVTEVMDQIGERWGIDSSNSTNVGILVTVGSLMNIQRIMELRGRSRGVHYALHSIGEQALGHRRIAPASDSLPARPTETITVHAAGKSYADLLRTVKGSIQSSVDAPAILFIRKAGKGMEILVLEDPTRRGELVRDLRAVDGVQASPKGRQAFIRIQDLDEEITPAEVQAGIVYNGLAWHKHKRSFLHITSEIQDKRETCKTYQMREFLTLSRHVFLKSSF